MFSTNQIDDLYTVSTVLSIIYIFRSCLYDSVSIRKNAGYDSCEHM